MNKKKKLEIYKLLHEIENKIESIYFELDEHKGDEIGQDDYELVKVRKKMKTPNGNTERLKFIGHRIGELMQRYHMTRKNASLMAQAMWREHKEQNNSPKDTNKPNGAE